MRKRLGELLVAAGVVDDLQLKSALAEAARWGKRVGEVLVARGMCTERQIMEALSSQLGVGIAPLSTTVLIPSRVLRLVPGQLARERHVLPLFLDGRTGTLDVAMSDPASYELIDELRFRTGHEVRPLVAAASDLADAIEHFYFGRPRNPVEPEPFASYEADAWLEGIDPPEGFELDRPGLQVVASPVPEEPVRVRRERPTTPTPEPVAAELARLVLEVAEMRERLEEMRGVLREAAAAHRSLLAELEARGVIDRGEYMRRMQAALQRAEPGPR